MDTALSSAKCFVCAKHALGDAAPGGVLFEDQLVYAGHAYPLDEPESAYRGYLVAEPRRHAAGLGDLTDPEALAPGLLVSRLARALKEVAGAEHVYSFVLGDGLAHLHVVLAPRYAGTRVNFGESDCESGPTHLGLARLMCEGWLLDSGHTEWLSEERPVAGREHRSERERELTGGPVAARESCRAERSALQGRGP
jgi:diadenosine tetraphosphate (Ap4A) HIT family hydrolase